MSFLASVVAVLVAAACLCAAQTPIDYSFNQTLMSTAGATAGTNNFFGWALSMDYNASYMIVGAPLSSAGSNDFQGKAYMFARSGEIGSADLSWSQRGPPLVSPQNQTYGFFGQAVWIGLNDSGDAMAAVFSMRSNREGRVYLYEKLVAAANFTSGGTLANPSVVGPVFPNQPYRFGEAITGDLRVNRMVIGSFRYLAKTGAAYVYTYGGSSWTLSQNLSAPIAEQAESSGFGISLSMDGNNLAIGASGYGLNRGRVYIYTLNAGTYNYLKAIRSLDGAIGDQFGWSLALSNETLAVGANRREDCGIACGSAYIFMKDVGDLPNETIVDNWGQLLKVSRKSGEENELFGSSIALNGDFMVVGAPQRSIDNITVDTGALFVFQRNTNADGFYGENEWGEVGVFSHDSFNARDRIGRCVATYAPHVMSSAMLYDVGSLSNAGAVFTFFGNNVPIGGVTGNPPVQPNSTTTDATTTTGSTTTGSGTSEITVSAASELAWLLF